MTIESLLGSLSTTEKLDAMDFLWRDLTKNTGEFSSPDWHEAVLAERLGNPSPGPRLPLAEALEDAKERLNARRTQG